MEAHRYAGQGQSLVVIVHNEVDVLFVWGQTGRVEKASELSVFFQQRYFVATSGGHKGCFHAGRTCADDHDVLRSGRGRQIVGLFQTGERIQRTAYPCTARRASHASLIAGDAADDGSVGILYLFRQEGVGNEGTSHGDKIGLFLFKDLFRHMLIGDAPCNDDGNGGPDAFPYAGGKLGIAGSGNAGRRGYHEVRFAQSYGDMKTVDALRNQGCGKRPGIFQRDASGDTFYGAHPVGDRKIIAYPASYFTVDFQSKAHAVFQRASPGIPAAIGIGREELADEIAVGSVQFYGVQSCLSGPDGGVTPCGNEHGYFLFGNFSRIRVGSESGNGRYHENGLTGCRRIGGTAAVLELNGHSCSMTFHAGCHVLQSGNAPVAGKTETAGEGIAGRMNVGRLHRDKTGSTHGAGLIIVDHALGDRAVRRCELRGHGRKNDAVLQRERTELNGRKKLHERLHHEKRKNIFLTLIGLQ